MKRIYIKEAIKQLDYKDRRSFNRWCSKNNVGILSDSGSTKQYVLETEFASAMSKIPFKYLERKYGKAKAIEMSAHSELHEEKERQLHFKEHRPTGEHANEFLLRLTKNLSEQ